MLNIQNEKSTNKKKRGVSLRQAKNADKAKLYRYWLKNDKRKSKAFHDAYFHYEFKASDHRFIEIDEQILSSCASRSKVLSLHGNHLQSNLILGPIYTDLDFAKTIFEEELKRSSQNNLISFVYPSPNFDYSDYGFETVVEHYQYNIPISSLPNLGVSGIVLDPSSEDLMKVYSSFTDFFTGYFVRTVEEFKNLSTMYKSLGGGAIAYVENQEILGYAFYVRHQTFVEVTEVCYNNSGTLLRLLGFLSKGMSRIMMMASESERIQKILPDVKRTKHPFLLARINDRELFERLYHIKIISAYSGFHAFGKPVFNRNFMG